MRPCSLPQRSNTAISRSCSPPLTGDEKHDWSALSTLDVLWVLYDRVLRVDPRVPDDPERDRFLLSKGHGPAAYYAVLAAKGFVDVESLAGFGGFDSRLGYHPDRRWSRAWRSPAARSATGCRSRWAWRSRSRRGGRRRRASSASSATPSSTRAATGRRCSSPAGSASGGSRWSWSTTNPRPTTGPEGSTHASRSRAGARRASTAAITTRSSGRFTATGAPADVVVAEVQR